MSWEGLDLFEEETAHEGLRYGDYVYLDALVEDGPPGFLWAEGQVFKRVGLQMMDKIFSSEKYPANFGQCIFRVTPQLQYENQAAVRDAAPMPAPCLRSVATQSAQPAPMKIVPRRAASPRRSRWSPASPPCRAALARPSSRCFRSSGARRLRVVTLSSPILVSATILYALLRPRVTRGAIRRCRSARRRRRSLRALAGRTRTARSVDSSPSPLRQLRGLQRGNSASADELMQVNKRVLTEQNKNAENLKRLDEMDMIPVRYGDKVQVRSPRAATRRRRHGLVALLILFELGVTARRRGARASARRETRRAVEF